MIKYAQLQDHVRNFEKIRAESMMVEDDEELAFKEFMEILAPRIEEARQRKFSTLSIEDIIAKAKSQSRRKNRGRSSCKAK